MNETDNNSMTVASEPVVTDKPTADKKPARDTSILNDLEAKKLKRFIKNAEDEKLGTRQFWEWYDRKKPQEAKETDATAKALLEALEALDHARGPKKQLNFGRYGYTVRRLRKKGSSGFVITRNEKE